MRRTLLAFSLALSATPALAEEQRIDTFTLKNGMEVIVMENHRVPAVNHTLWFRVGAADDPVGKSGLAHYHEHMMFQGTAKHKAGEYSDIIARLGGRQNAFTGHDATAYYASIDVKNLPRLMELEADRLRGLHPTPENALKEREVIIEERRSRTDNVPEALFAEQMQAALYLNHPYQLPVIGWKHEMEGLTKDDAEAIHKRYYHPGNAVLVVAGDITAEQFKPLAEKYYGDIPAGPKVERKWTSEPPQLSPRRLTMHHALVKLPSWHRTYLMPSMNSGDKTQVLPLSVLENVLGGGKTGRLYDELVVKRKLASGISVGYQGFTLGPGEFSFSASPVPGVSIEKLEQAVTAELDKQLADIGKNGITAAELSRAKTLLKAGMLYSRDGLEGAARTMGWLRAIGLPVSYYHEWPQHVDAVTAESVRNAARSAFDIRQSVTGVLLPEEK